MVQFKEFIDAYAEVYNLQHLDRSALVDNAIKHLSNVLLERENFRAVCSYIKEFIEHYHTMKERHLEAEVWQRIEAGDTFFNACREWDI